ncbi:MAG: hypothetical protein SF052_10065 [Bacteroidia bacterium]|nr:hypothetical protein [Bacteroidia bacterium]
MKLLHTFFFSLVFLALMGACKSPDYQPDTYPDSQIIFGSGGGFSGMVSSYILLEDGRLFDKAPTSEAFSRLKKVNRKSARQLFDQLTQMKESGTTLDAPGNLYYFIELKEAQSESYKLTWGDGGSPAPEAVVAFYQTLMDATR